MSANLHQGLDRRRQQCRRDEQNYRQYHYIRFARHRLLSRFRPPLCLWQIPATFTPGRPKTALAKENLGKTGDIGHFGGQNCDPMHSRDTTGCTALVRHTGSDLHPAPNVATQR